MDFRHLIVTCLFSMLRLSFENQKNKKNYAILFENMQEFVQKILVFVQIRPKASGCFLSDKP